MKYTLMLHRVLPKHCAHNYYFRRGTAISFDHFCRMLDALQKNHWHSITTLDKHETHKRHVCITFDDGYADNALALDELLARGLRATLFVVKNFCVENFSPIDDMAAWLSETHNAPAALIKSLESGRLKKILRNMSAQRYRYFRKHYFALNEHKRAAQFLTEQQLRDYHRCGVAIGIHGATHRIWSRLSAVQLQAEINETARWLRNLGVTEVAGLCFPHGKYRCCTNLSTNIARLAEVGLFGVTQMYSDTMVTPRIWIKQDTDVAQLFSAHSHALPQHLLGAN